MKHISEFFEEALKPVLDRAEQAKQALEKAAELRQAEEAQHLAEGERA